MTEEFGGSCSGACLTSCCWPRLCWMLWLWTLSRWSPSCCSCLLLSLLGCGLMLSYLYLLAPHEESRAAASARRWLRLSSWTCSRPAWIAGPEQPWVCSLGLRRPASLVGLLWQLWGRLISSSRPSLMEWCLLAGQPHLSPVPCIGFGLSVLPLAARWWWRDRSSSSLTPGLVLASCLEAVSSALIIYLRHLVALPQMELVSSRLPEPQR